MYRFYSIVFFFGIIILISAIADDYFFKKSVKRDPHAKLVIFGARHGNRNPAMFLNESKGYYGFEGPMELTSFGKRQGYAFGREMRVFLQGFLNGNYLPSEASFYTSSASRTQMTLQTVLAGLFPPRSFAVWNLALDWSPVPYTIDDAMLRMYNVVCPQSDTVWKPIDDETLDAMITKKEEVDPILQYISAHTGWSPTFNSAADLADNIDQFEIHNFSLPDWLDIDNFTMSTNSTLVDEIMALQEYPQIQCANYKPCQNMMAGVWLQTISERLRKFSNETEGNEAPQKLLGFISHTEIVLSAMLAMGLKTDRVEPTAGFILEVRDTPMWEARLLEHQPLAADEHLIFRANYGPELQKMTSNDEWILLDDLVEFIRSNAIPNWPLACGIEKEDTGDIPSDTDKLIVDVLEVAKMEKEKSNSALFLVECCYGAPQYPEAIIEPPGHVPPSDDVLKTVMKEPEKSLPPNPKSLPIVDQPQPPLPEPPKSSPKIVDDSEFQQVEVQQEESKPETAKSEVNYKNDGCVSDTIFVVDSTGSVRTIFEKHRTYVSNVVKGLDISSEKSHVGVIVYSSKYRQKIKISLADPQDKQNISNIIANLPYFSGVTATGRALQLAQEDLKNRRPDVMTNLVVITDGFSYDHIDEPVKELHQMNNLRTFAVSLSEVNGRFELLMISGTEDNLLNGDDSYKELLSRLQECNEKSESANSVLSNESDGSDKEKKKSTGSSNCKFDVVFVIDASGSLRQRYLKQLELACELVEIFGENSDFALIKYSGKRQVKVSVPLGSNKTMSEFKSIVSTARFMGGTTYTNLALDKAFEQMQGSGRNQGALPIVIVFTDGFSRANPLPNAKKIHEKSIPVFAVGVSDGTTVNENELRDIASSPAHVYLDTTFQTLKDTLTQLSKSC